MSDTNGSDKKKKSKKSKELKEEAAAIAVTGPAAKAERKKEKRAAEAAGTNGDDIADEQPKSKKARRAPSKKVTTSQTTWEDIRCDQKCIITCGPRADIEKSVLKAPELTPQMTKWNIEKGTRYWGRNRSEQEGDHVEKYCREQEAEEKKIAIPLILFVAGEDGFAYKCTIVRLIWDSNTELTRVWTDRPKDHVIWILDDIYEIRPMVPRCIALQFFGLSPYWKIQGASVKPFCLSGAQVKRLSSSTAALAYPKYALIHPRKRYSWMDNPAKFEKHAAKVVAKMKEKPYVETSEKWDEKKIDT